MEDLDEAPAWKIAIWLAVMTAAIVVVVPLWAIESIRDRWRR